MDKFIKEKKITAPSGPVGALSGVASSTRRSSSDWTNEGRKVDHRATSRSDKTTGDQSHTVNFEILPKLSTLKYIVKKASSTSDAARKKFNDYRAVLSETQEKELVNYILISETLCGVTLTGLQQLVSQIAKKNNILGNFPSEAYNIIIKNISEDIR